MPEPIARRGGGRRLGLVPFIHYYCREAAKQMPNFIDLTGKKFGRWTVIRRDVDTRYKHPQFLCRCECGEERVVKSQTLRHGESKSCGCYNKEVRRNVCIERNTTHGKRHTRVYNIWAGMIQRGTNPKTRNFSNYGARGVSVCERWRTFENFYADMGEPAPGQSIDRVNVHGNYEPGNCRWATSGEQNRNRSNNRRIVFNGEDLTITEWCRRVGVSGTTMTARLGFLGWPIERALTEGPLGRGASR